MQAACYDIYSRDAAALAACLAYLCEVEQFTLKTEAAMPGHGLHLQPVVHIWPRPQNNWAPGGASVEAEVDTLVWEVASPGDLEQLGQRAAFYQYRQQQEGIAAAILQSNALQYHGQNAWQILDLDGRRWIFQVRQKV